MAVWVVGRCVRWQFEQTAVVGCVKVDGVQTEVLWQLWQVAGYFVVLAVCVAGLCVRWQFEQFAVVTM